MNLKRVVCFVQSHRWAKRQYPNDEPGAGYYLRCLRCGKDNHGTGRTHGHMGTTGMGGALG